MTLQTVVETSAFIARAKRLLDENQHAALIASLANHPERGDEIVGTGGVRKLRFAAMGKGKSGGVRVIYFFLDRNTPIYALLIYGKSERADITGEQRRTVAAFAKALKAKGTLE